MQSFNTICNVPFGFIEIFGNGDVYTCCPSYIEDGCIGNIFEQEFEDILNSEKAVKIRKNVLNKDYSMCRKELCSSNTMPFSYQLNSKYCKVDFKEKIKKVNIIKFSYDRDCNIKCRSCRDELLRNTKENIEDLDIKAYKYFLPIIKYTDKVCLIGSGDPLASKHTRNFIKMIVKEYTNIKFDLHTNGLLLNKNILEELNIIDKISVIQISIHASTKETYNKIALGGNYDKLMENLEFVSELKKNSIIEDIHINFVIQNNNINDAKGFVTLAKNIDAKCFFWTMRNLGTNYCLEEIADDYDVYKTFKNKIFREKHCSLNPYIYKLSSNKNFIEDYLVGKINFYNNENKKLNTVISNINNSISNINRKIDFYNNNNINMYNRIINLLAWWIPIKKWRESFRNKFQI